MLAVEETRRDQHSQWGESPHDFPIWNLLLTEEVGELSNEILILRTTISALKEDPKQAGILRDKLLRLKVEAADVAAVAVAIIEHAEHLSSAIDYEKMEDPESAQEAVALLEQHGAMGW